MRLAQVHAPSLVLQVRCVGAARDALASSAVATGTIGATGRDRTGQLMVQTPWRAGVAVRLCEAATCSPAFSEGTEALLEGVLPEFRKPHETVASPAEYETLMADLRSNSDCWVDVRAMMRHPAGFFR